MKDDIKVIGAAEHNLKDVTVNIPKGKFVVFSGVSGSGKSSLVFNTIYAEAQRQLLDTFSTYTRSRMPKISRPKVEDIQNLPVAIVIDQKRLGRNSSSTVGTVTEIYSYMRLLFSRCGSPQIGDSVKFSFNRPEGMCPDCRGTGKKLKINENLLLNWDLSLKEGAITHPGYKLDGWVLKSVLASGLFDNNTPVKNFTREQLDLLLYSGKMKMNNKTEERQFNLNYVGIVNRFKRDAANREENQEDSLVPAYYDLITCETCDGARITAEALSVRINGMGIKELCQMELTKLNNFLQTVPSSLDNMGKTIASSIILRIRKRLTYLIEIGVGYLSLDRQTGTLSGGESQRVKMAKQLDCDLTGLVYILDEPSIGLHPGDVTNLISILKRLRNKGNTVIVIEHDEAIISSADHVIDVGPGGGTEGGLIVFEGNVANLKQSGSTTGLYLDKKGFMSSLCRTPSGYFEITNASANNLKNISLSIPSGVLVCVTGVAGSGKSTLVNDVFASTYKEAVIIDQSAVTRSRRSTPASYTKVLDLIRKEFSKATGESPGLFSFNSTGACPDCKGLGEIDVEMHFLESVTVTCETCKGKRFKSEVLNMHKNGLNISEVLSLTINDAIAFFEHKEIKRRLQLLSDVGLGYLGLGQNLGTLSGGEAQRVKLGSELRKSGHIYIMDEPTTGLHMADIHKFSDLVHKLVNSGNSVIIIEHNLEIISQADWIIDLGPEGGSQGGRIIAEGTPPEIISAPGSVTGKYLQEYIPELIVSAG